MLHHLQLILSSIPFHFKLLPWNTPHSSFPALVSFNLHEASGTLSSLGTEGAGICPLNSSLSISLVSLVLASLKSSVISTGESAY